MTLRTPTRSAASATRKNELVLELIAARRRRALRGLGASMCVRRERRASRRAVVSSSTNAHDVLAAAGIEELFDAVVDGVRRRARAPARASPRRTPIWRARGRSASEPGEAAVFEDALAGVEAGRAGDFGFVVGVDRLGQADALRAHGADVVVADLARAAAARRDPAPARSRSSPGRCARPRSTSTTSRRASPCSRWPTATSACVATSTRVSRSASRAPIWPASTRLASSLCGGRLRLSRRPARRSSTSPTASCCACSSRMSRSTCATATLRLPRAGARPPCRRLAAAASSGSRRRAGLIRVSSTRLVSLSRGARSPRSATRSSRGGHAPDRRSIGAGRQRAAARAPERSARSGAQDRAPLRSERCRRAGRARACSSMRPAPATCGGRRDGPRGRRPGGCDVGRGGQRGPRARDLRDRRGRGVSRSAIVKYLAYGWSGERSVPALQDQVAAALASAIAAAGTPCWPSSAPTSTTSGSGPTSRSTATTSCSRPCASRSFTSSRRGRAASSGRSPRRDSPGRATTATPSGTPRRSCCRC